MLRIEHLSFQYRGAAAPALRDVSFSAAGGELLAVRGSSGCGKSTLVNCLNGIIPNVVEGSLRGGVFIKGRPAGGYTLREISCIVGTVFQNPSSQLFMPVVEEDVALGYRLLRGDCGEMRKRVDEALDELGLEGIRKRHISELSGGEKQRVAIAGMYALKPDIFLFDESASDLDEKGREAFAGILRKLKRRGHTVILIEHETSYAGPLVDREIALDNCFLRERGPFPEAAPASVPCGQLTGDTPAVSVRGAGYSYNGRHCALDGIDLEFSPGEFAAITGDNGCGKTTLFKLMAGILRPLKGEVFIGGSRLRSLDSVVGRVGFLFQDPDEQLFCTSVHREVLLGPDNLKIKFDASAYLSFFGMSAMKERYPFTLSTGEKQRLAFLAIMSMQAGVLLLDEPTTGLDESDWRRLLDLAVFFNRCGKTVLFSSHNKKAVDLYARRVVRLAQGRVASDEVRK